MRPVNLNALQKALKKSKLVPTGNESEAEGRKHFIYFLSIMAETRIANYFTVVADTNSIFKTSTEQICECIGRWKSHQKHLQDSSTEISKEERLTFFGENILRLGEILGSLQAEDPVAFWAQVDSIHEAIIPLAKAVGKLRRKLMRISDGIMPDLKNLRSLAEIHGLLAKIEKEVDVTEDFGNYVESVTDCEIIEFLPAQNKTSQVDNKEESVSTEAGCSRVFQRIQNMFNKKEESVSKRSKTKPRRNKNKFKKFSSAVSEVVEIKVPSPTKKPSEKQLQKIASSLQAAQKLEYIMDPNNKTVPLTIEEQEELWKKLDIDNLDEPIKAPQRVESPLVSEELDDHEVKAIFEEQAKKYLPRSQELDDSKKKISEKVQINNVNQNHEINIMTAMTSALEKILPQSKPIKSENLKTQLEECEKTLDSIGITKIPEILPHFHQDLNNSSKTADPQKRISYLSQYRNFVNQMQEDVMTTMTKIRLVERSWINTSTRALGFNSFMKIGNMLDYVRKTIALMGDPQFMEHIYPETKSNILDALDQVYREFHSCFIALGELAEIVSKDSFYLRELLDNLPKGDPIVYEFSSNPSLGSFDQIENSGDLPTRSCFLDVDAIFD